MAPLKLIISALSVVMFSLSPIVHAATVNVVNMDGPNEGFNDTTPFTAVGGNNATTLGQARLNAFRYAASLIGDQLTSSVVISVEAEMNPLGGTSTSTTLGSAGAVYLFKDFPGAPQTSTWYVPALANKISGSDLNPAANDIGATFNSDLDGTIVLGDIKWYYGLDGAPPGNDTDFVSTVLHEIIHGLGFTTQVDLGSGMKAAGFDDAYIMFLEYHGATPADYPSMTDAGRIAASTSITPGHWKDHSG